jgi:hypothetical protein
MNLKISLILLLIAILIFGCTDDIPIDGAADTKNTTQLQCPVCEEKVCPKVECPECKECEECEDCEKKDCPKCPVCKEKTCPTCPTCQTCETCKDFGSAPVDIELNVLRLYKQEVPELTAHERFFIYDNDSLAKIETAELTFIPKCDGTSQKRLTLMLNGKSIYNQVPVCDKKVQLNLPKSYLIAETQNNISFTSDVTKSYRIDTLELETKYNDSTYNLEIFDFIRFEEREPQSMPILNFSDVIITNSLTYYFNLTDDDKKHDMIFKYDAKKTAGYLYVKVNNRNIFDGDINRTNNEIIISKGYLKNTDNVIEFIGIN